MGSFDFAHCGHKQHYACFACRKAFKAGDEFVPTAPGVLVRRVVACPDCTRPMCPMGLLFRAPKRRAVKAWRRAEAAARRLPHPPFQYPQPRPIEGGCPGCRSAGGWDGRRCLYCGFRADTR